MIVDVLVDAAGNVLGCWKPRAWTTADLSHGRRIIKKDMPEAGAAEAFDYKEVSGVLTLLPESERPAFRKVTAAPKEI